MKDTRPKRIVSGGQTGVDRAALDIALALGIPHGGWCPSGRKAEDGRLPERYLLEETPSSDYAPRTRWNVRDSDGTLVLTRGEAIGGTALTIKTAEEQRKPLLTYDLGTGPGPETIRTWLSREGIAMLNVAGPRESESPGVYDLAKSLLESVFGTARTP
jgi:hypothetical protein